MTRVLLYSGGLDSMAVSMLWPHEMKLYVNMKTRYSEAELAHLTKTLGVPGLTVVELPLTQFERSDGIVPMRNLLLLAIASIYGEDIAYGAIAGERMLDKTPTFAMLAEALLSYMWRDGEPGRRPQGWTNGKRITIHQPVVHLSKEQLLREVDARCGRRALEQLAHESWSCYDPWSDHSGPAGHPERCGRCKPCVRNWLAFYAVGITLPYEVETDVLAAYTKGRPGRESELALAALAGRAAGR